jgi:hypothetical protein
VRPGPRTHRSCRATLQADKEAAILFSLANISQLSNVDPQLEIWAILDLNDALLAGLTPTQEKNHSRELFYLLRAWR